MKGKRIWTRVAVLAVVAGAVGFGLMGDRRVKAAPDSGAGWLAEYGNQIDRNVFSQLRDTGNDFLEGLKTKAPEEVMNNLYADTFPEKPESRKKITKDIVDLIDFRGKPVDYHFVGLRSLENTRRYYIMYFLSYHGKNNVTAWEIEFVRVGKDGWKIYDMAFDAYSPYEFIRRIK